jgi:GTP-binding protein
MTDQVFSDVRFIKSITSIHQIPKPDYPEIIFAGRSNVGKSSLLNCLLSRKKLARISSSPGKTQVINYYLVNEQFYFVDLPGYGYAKLSKKVRNQWPRMIENFFKGNKRQKLICLLIDSRHSLQSLDKDMITWLEHQCLPFIIVLTKIDKLNQKEFEQQLRKFLAILPEYQIIPFTIRKKKYKQELQNILLSHIIDMS